MVVNVGEGTTPATLQGLERAFAILERLAERPMRAKELADLLGLKWATAHRTLTFLRHSECLAYEDATGLYRIGPRLYYLGSAYLGSVPLVTAALPLLRIASRETGATAQLVVRYRRRSMNLIVVESTGHIVPRSTIDFHFPLHCGSKGRVLLAYADDEFIEQYLSVPLETLTENTLTNSEELRRRLRNIRLQGYEVTQGDVQVSTGSVAAPIQDATGKMIAAITLIVGIQQLERLEDQLIDTVLRTARSISLGIGWRNEPI